MEKERKNEWRFIQKSEISKNSKTVKICRDKFDKKLSLTKLVKFVVTEMTWYLPKQDSLTKSIPICLLIIFLRFGNSNLVHKAGYTLTNN